MDFVSVDVREQLIQEVVGTVEFNDAICGQQRRETFLPVVVTAFDFTFGLGRGSVAEGNAVEVECRAELGEGLWRMSKKEGVVVHVECQGQAMGFKGAGEEVEVSQEVFGVIEAGLDIITCGIVQ